MPVIHCAGLNKRFGPKIVLDNINLTIDPGGPIGVVGPNGAGKTTFFSVLSGFLKPSAGTVRILGHKPNSPALKRKFSVLPQDADFPKTTSVMTTLKFFAQLQGLRAHEARIEAKHVLDLVNLEHTAVFYPDKLSHGMKKRLAIAQALIGKPEIILLDEPTAGLDPVTAAKIRTVIEQRSAHTTFLISSHNLEEIENLCASILIFNHGKLIKQDKIANLINRTGVLTISLDSPAPPSLLQQMHNLAGITDVTAPGEGKILILSFEQTKAKQIQIEVMQCLLNSDTAYREIKTGQSLAQQVVNITEK